MILLLWVTELNVSLVISQYVRQDYYRLFSQCFCDHSHQGEAVLARLPLIDGAFGQPVGVDELVEGPGRPEQRGSVFCILSVDLLDVLTGAQESRRHRG